MAEGVSTSGDAAAERAAEQARLRKERREAKIKAGGSSRLNKITGMGGRIVGETSAPSTPPTETTTTAPPLATTTSQPHSADPEEIDISQHFYNPGQDARQKFPASGPMGAPMEGPISEAQLRQMILGLDNPAGSSPSGPAQPDDLMSMMSQLMAAGAGGDQPGAGGFPGAGQSLFPGMPPFPGMPGMTPQQQAPPDPYKSLWRILHALVAISLGLYIILLTPFAGTKVEREREAIASDPLADEMQHHKRLFFWIFATAETVLLTTRLFLDSSRATPSGIVWTVVSYLPEPFKGYVTVALRYWQIFSTVRSDILACIFVLGVCSWWRG
ncbi:hypothetical protein S40293_03362 [Stachybotrys chartarum IBT 40293]|nr:hypothetical protein S40293_03362 [Stachybotrys chartarum IBT 40293]